MSNLHPALAAVRSAAGPRSSVTELLTVAAERMIDRCRQTHSADDPDQTAVHAHLLVQAIEAGFANGKLRLDRRLITPQGRRLVQRLRAEILRLAQEDPTEAGPDEVLSLFTALQGSEQAIEEAISAPELAPLTGPDGLELVVEVAHDLRSPVTSVLFLSDTLLTGRSGAVNDLQRRQLGLIYSAALALSSVASDLIEHAQGGDRLLERMPVPFSLVETLDAVRDITRPIAEEKQLEVRIETPSSPARLGYPIALNRVLLNLTTNALKFTHEGSVEVTARAVGWKRVEFAVRDTGPGVPPEAMDTLYQPFRRSAGHRNLQFSGTGLGLAICRRLVKAMGSELQMSAERDRGTRFFFEIDLPPVETV